MRYVLMILMVTGCGSKISYIAGLEVQNVDLKPYFDRYLDEKEARFGSRDVNYPIQVDFGFVMTPTIGLCRSYTDSNKRYIIIDVGYWQAMSEDSRLQLVYHEMGHCDLDLDHGRGGLIMEPRQINDWTFRGNYDNLVSELFGGLR